MRKIEIENQEEMIDIITVEVVIMTNIPFELDGQMIPIHRQVHHITKEMVNINSIK